MKNPNGYGSVVKLSGNRRNPFCARKTIGWNEKKHPIYKTIGYYSTRADAVIALAEYNRDPYDIDLSKISMSELYERWSRREFPKMPPSSISGHRAAFKHSAPLHKCPYKQIKAYHMQDIIDNCGYGYSTQGAIKNLFNQLDRYAMELDIITKCNSTLIHTDPIPPSNRRPFTEKELDAIWEIKNEPYADTILILLYTGLRIGELLTLKTEQVQLKEHYLQGGIKTNAGRDRIIPIHPRIYDIMAARVREGNEYLVSWKGKQMPKSQYYLIWNKLMERLNLDHTPHECRHTFRSRLDSAGANKVCIDLMMGHKSKEVGERVYTHKALAELAFAISLVT